jgi:cell division septum initiation protein DivIVA
MQDARETHDEDAEEKQRMKQEGQDLEEQMKQAYKDLSSSHKCNLERVGEEHLVEQKRNSTDPNEVEWIQKQLEDLESFFCAMNRDDLVEILRPARRMKWTLTSKTRSDHFMKPIQRDLSKDLTTTSLRLLNQPWSMSGWLLGLAVQG